MSTYVYSLDSLNKEQNKMNTDGSPYKRVRIAGPDANADGVDQTRDQHNGKEREDLEKKLEAAQKQTEAAQKQTEAAQKQTEAVEKKMEAENKKIEAEIKEIEANIERARKYIEAEKKKTRIFDEVSLRRLIVDKPNLLLQCNGSETSTIGSSNHATAVSIEMPDCVVLENIDDTAVNLDRISNLLQTHKANYGAYCSEADVSAYMGGALRDACSMAEDSTKISFRTYREFSLWSGRPDHLVVWNHVNSDPILAVEDKKPFYERGKKNEIPGPVQGQMFDYLMELRCLGHSAPFAVLSDFNFSWLFWQKGKVSENLLKAEDKVKLVSKGLEKTPTKGNGAEQNETPPAKKLVNEVTSFDTSESTRSIFSVCERTGNLNHSQRFENKELVPLLYTAILCGLAQNPSALRKQQIIDRKSYDDMALKLMEKSYDWGHLKFKVGTCIGFWKGKTQSRQGKFQKHGQKVFFAIANIGRGHTSKVFEAYDSSGHLCAIKIYVKQCKDSNGKALTNENSRKEGKNVCLKEIERLIQAYPFLEEKVSFQLVNNLPSIIMPYFQPLTDIERKDEKVKNEIRACLRKFCEKGTNKKLMYAEADLHWRHIGRYQDTAGEELVMFDLADLVEVEDTNKNHIESQLNTLLDRLT